jgi:hypothetical protein
MLVAAGSIGLVAVASPALDPGLLGRALKEVRTPDALASANPIGKASAIMRGAATASAIAPAGAAHSAVALARLGLERHGAHIVHRDVVAVADFSRPSSEPRLHLINMVSGHIERLQVAHGRGSDPARTGWLRRFSNAPGSDCTSQGAYVTGPYYVGEHGRSMRVEGLDPTNSNAAARAIVIHPAWYANPGMVRVTGMLGRSDGCFAVSQANAVKLLERLGPGRLLIATRLT